MATATMTAVSPKQIEESRRLAADLCLAAYGPQRTSVGDLLCWEGRIAKAMQIGNAATQAGDNGKLAQVNQALDILCKERTKATSAAEKAASDYGVLCASVGVDMADVYPAKCTCDGCKLSLAQQTARDALHSMREAIYALLLPSEDGKSLPVLVELAEAVGKGDEVQYKQLWAMVSAIANAQRAYGQALGVLGERPRWDRVLR